MMDDLIENEIIFKSVCNRKWKKASYDQSRSLLIEQKKGVESIIAEMLSRRSLEYNDIDSFLEPKLRTSLPNPDIIKDMSVAVDTVYGAIKSKRKIAVFGDYDVDGATSSAVLKRFFRTIAVEVNIYIPDRVSEGYGPNINAFKELREQGVEIIITVDCGTAAHAVIEEGRNLGLDIIVLDHHISESPVLPSANAIVNPNRIDDNSGLNNLAAVGVTFLFVVALSKKIANQDLAVADNHSKKLLQLLDLVALGTVCDVVPLTGLNRAFVRQGLSIMSKTHNVGLKALLDFLSVKDRITPYHLGFVLGPRVNAGGRVGKASLGAELLTCDDYDRAYEIAAMLDSFNTERKLIEANVLKDALEQAASIKESNCIVVAGQGWHQGVIGIVASRIQEKYNKPSIVISFDSNDLGKASCRSIEGVNIGQIISKAYQDGILLAGGGHAMAAGFSLVKDKLEELKYFLESNISKDEIKKNKNKVLTYESLLSANHVNIDFINKINLFGPFGSGNESPKFMLRNVIITDVNVFQSLHISCLMKDADNISSSFFKAIAFRAIESPMGELLLAKGKVLNLIVTLGINYWNNLQKPEAVIIDIIE